MTPPTVCALVPHAPESRIDDFRPGWSSGPACTLEPPRIVETPSGFILDQRLPEERSRLANPILIGAFFGVGAAAIFIFRPLTLSSILLSLATTAIGGATVLLLVRLGQIAESQRLSLGPWLEFDRPGGLFRLPRHHLVVPLTDVLHFRWIVGVSVHDSNPEELDSELQLVFRNSAGSLRVISVCPVVADAHLRDVARLSCIDTYRILANDPGSSTIELYPDGPALTRERYLSLACSPNRKFGFEVASSGAG